jgi:anaerobic dimethyl sulfoxide reductase subunit A
MDGSEMSNRAINNVASDTLTRRSFIKWSTVLGSSVALTGGLVACAPAPEDSNSNAVLAVEEGEWKPTPCKQDNGNCGDCCINFALVKDGVVVRMKTDDTREDTTDNPLRKGCLRGRSFRQYAYGEGRLKYPMKRKNWQPGGGDNSSGHLRGIDEWERISWEEALDLAATEIKRIIDTHGNASIFDGGEVLNHIGGSVGSYGPISSGASPLVYQLAAGGSLARPCADRFAQRDAKLIVYWSMNCAWSYPTAISYNIQQARKAGAKVILVTPEYCASAVALGAEWIPVRPNTDAAMLIGMAHHMIENNLQDQDFLDRCCIGFDAAHMPEGEDPKGNFKDYVLGTYDGVPKTPEWASEICGVDPAKIRSFAEEIASVKPAIIDSGLAGFRTHLGHQFGQALFTVGWMSGNIGIHASGVGVSPDARGWSTISIVANGSTGEPTVPNPLVRPDSPNYAGSWVSINPFDTESLVITHDELWDAILTGEFTATSRGKIPIDLKMVYLVKKTGSRMTNSSGAVKAIQAMRKLDFVLASDVVLSAKSLYADIVLPDTLQWEIDGYSRGYTDQETIVFGEQIIEPQFECKDEAWVERELLARLGGDPDAIHPYSARQRFFNKMAGAVVMNEVGEWEPVFSIDQEFIDEYGVEGTPQEGEVPIRDALKVGSYTARRKKGDAYTDMAETQAINFRKDPDANPLSYSESGKLEIYCRSLKTALEAYGFDKDVSPIPAYRPPEEGYENTFDDWENRIKGPYPLQSITPP